MALKTENAESTTKTRIVAVASVKNFVSFACMQQMMSRISPYELHLNNMDASQFTVVYDSNQKVQVKYVGITAYFIKYYMLMSASEFVGPPVYVITDDNMNSLEIDT